MKNTKGFTLIELLVVITIIGILATGASTVYTSAQQKARDSIRQQDLMALKSSVEQSYGDDGEYLKPSSLIGADLLDADGNPGSDGTLDTGLVPQGYMTTLPSDPKTLNADTETTFVYTYAAGKDTKTNVQGQIYEISANFENGGNAGKETGDVGNDDTRWEIGVSVATVDSSILADGTTIGTNDYSTTDLAVPAEIIDGN